MTLFLELYHTLPIGGLNPKIQIKHGKVDRAANKTRLMTNVDPISRLRARVIALLQFYYQHQIIALLHSSSDNAALLLYGMSIVVGDKIVNSLSFVHTRTNIQSNQSILSCII